MKIIKDMPVSVDIGTLDHKIRLPVESRSGMNIICDACRNPIEDKFFIGGFKTGHRNLILHESCAEEA